MPVPTAITDLSQTVGANFPLGTDAPSSLDDVQRAHASFIALLRDGKGHSATAALAAAATTDIGAQNSMFLDVSGATGITSFGTSYNGPRFLRFTGAPLLTHSAALSLPGAANLQVVAGDILIAAPNLAANGWNVLSIHRGGVPAASGANADITSFANAVTGQTAARGDDSTKLATTAYVVDATPQIQPVTASIAANALSVFLDPTQLDFRSSALGAAAINRRTVGSQISVVVSSGSTLGTFNGVKNRLVVLAIDAAGTVELAVCNIAYNSALDETQTISTVAEGGAGGADSATVIYSATARSGVPFRIVGYIESTQTTAGTWATAPSLVQGAGGNAARQHMSVGYHQAWTGVTRTAGTTYYNDTGRPIILAIHGTPDTSLAYIIVTVGGVAVFGHNSASSAYAAHQIMIPPGQTYVWTMSAGTLGNITCRELR